MKVILKHIHLENYKGIRVLDIPVYTRTRINGVNGIGKTTLMDAFFDTLTGKLASGKEPANIRPYDKDGNEIPKVDIVRELTFEIDGRETVIKKITKQKWRKPRGTTEEVFDGNDTVYEIDGFPAKQKDFTEFIERITKPETLLMCSNPIPFLRLLEKSTAEARKILEKLSGFDLQVFLSEHPEYASIAEITKGHSVEDTLKKLIKQKNEQKKKIDTKNAEIAYEQNRVVSPVDVDLSVLELSLNAMNDELKRIDEEELLLEGASKNYDEMQQKVMNLKFEQSNIVANVNAGLMTQRRDSRRAIDDVVCRIRGIESIRDRDCDSLARIKKEIESLEDRKKKLLRDWQEEKVREKSETNEFCPHCKQRLPEEMLQNEKEMFLKEKEYKLSQIEKQGNKIAEDIKETLNQVSIYEEKITGMTNEVAELEKTRAECEAIYNELPTSMDMSDCEEYKAITKQIAELEAEIETLRNIPEKRSELREARRNIMADISAVEAKKKAQFDAEHFKEAQIQRLNEELLNLSQTMADIECQIDIAKNFSIAKNEALAEKINPYFKHFSFKFLDYTIEGNSYETCRLICNGSDYMNGLNGGDKKLCEAYLVAGLQKLNGLSLPIWLDESNTIDSWRIPTDMEQQIFVIQRSDDKELIVEEM